jgi:Protein of unknown function (DUF4199)
MENKTSTSKFALQCGVLFGVIMILEFVIGYILNIDPTTNQSFGVIISVLNYFILPAILIYVACNAYKTKLNNGFISFGQCLKIGVTICIIAGLLYGLFSAAFGMMFPEYFEEMMKKMRIVMRDKNPEMTSEQIDMAITMSKKFMNPIISIPITVIMYAFIGLIISLIIGAIVKKDPNQSI